MKGIRLTKQTFGLILAIALITCSAFVVYAAAKYQRSIIAEQQLLNELQSTLQVVSKDIQHQDKDTDLINLFLISVDNTIDEIIDLIIENTNIVITTLIITTGSSYIDITISGHAPQNPKIHQTISKRLTP